DLVVQLGTQRRPQMAVNVEGRRDACVPKPGLDLLRVGTLSDEQPGGGMAKIVKSQILIQSARFQCGLEPAPTEHRAPEPRAVRTEEHKLPRRCLPQVLREQDRK